MKARKIALLAALPAAILAANSAMAATEVYGKINISLQDIQEEDDFGTYEDQYELISNASRFGIKASTDFGDTGLKGVAKIEYEIATDEGDFSGGDELKARNMYAGVQGGFGTVIAGQFDTPLKEAQGKVDLFNDLTYGDIKNYLSGENRMDDIIMYSTPKMDNGLAFNFAFMPGEGVDSDIDGEVDDSIADTYSTSLVYDSDTLYAALAYDDGVTGLDTIRLVGQFKMDDLALGAIIQQSEAGDEDTYGTYDEDSVILSASYKISKATLKLQYAMSEADVGLADDIEIDGFSLGVDYALDKKGKIFAYATENTDADDNIASGYEYEYSTFGVGYEYSF